MNTIRPATDRRPTAGSIHWSPSDRQILAKPATIAPWIDELRRLYREHPAQRAEFAAMGERLQRLHAQAFGARHP